MDDSSLEERVDKLESKVERLQDILSGVLTLLRHAGYKSSTIAYDEQALTIMEEKLKSLSDLDND